MRMIAWLFTIILTYGQAAACYKKVYDFYCSKEGCKASFNGNNMKLCRPELIFEMRGQSFQLYIDNKYWYQLSQSKPTCGGFGAKLSWKVKDLSRLYRFSAALKSVNGIRSPHYCDGKPYLVWGRVTVWASNLGPSTHALPTARPTKPPTNLPTPVPTAPPTMTPTHAPTARPTSVPSGSPTLVPTKSPTADPTITPTMSPTYSPTLAPTDSPTNMPTPVPLVRPTTVPTGAPTASPTLVPTDSPTMSPTSSPTVNLEVCVNIIEWTELAQENCKVRGALHLGWKRAQLCPIQLMDGFNKRVDEYESSLNHSMADHIFESCSTKCVYDIENTGVAYRWRTGDCWELVKDEECTISSVGFTWSFDHITDMVCHVDIPSDNPPQVPTSEQTPASIIINTDYPTEAPTLKPTSVPTIKHTPVSTLEANKKPTEASCMPRNCIPQQVWSEDLMDAYCSPGDTGPTYKHHCHIGRAAEPCRYQMLAENLKKSLAMRLYSDCSSTCVYDYYTNAHSAWRWSAADLCWEMQAWGPCHWDFKRRKMHPEWVAAKRRMSLFCQRSI